MNLTPSPRRPVVAYPGVDDGRPVQVDGNGYGDAPGRQYPVDRGGPLGMASLNNLGSGMDMIQHSRAPGMFPTPVAATRPAQALSDVQRPAYGNGHLQRPALSRSQGTLTQDQGDASSDPIFSDPNGLGMRSSLGGPKAALLPSYSGARRQIMGTSTPGDLDAMMRGAGSEPTSMIPASATRGIFDAANNPFSEMIAYANSARLSGGTGGSPVEPSYSSGGGGGSRGQTNDGGSYVSATSGLSALGGGTNSITGGNAITGTLSADARANLRPWGADFGQNATLDPEWLRRLYQWQQGDMRGIAA
jgi:hypothetical protein